MNLDLEPEPPTLDGVPMTMEDCERTIVDLFLLLTYDAQHRVFESLGDLLTYD